MNIGENLSVPLLKDETPMSLYVNMITGRYRHKHKGFKGFAKRGHSKKKK